MCSFVETSGAATSVMSAPVSPTDSCFPSSPSKFLDQISALFKSGGFLIRFCIYFTEKKRFHLGKHFQIWVGGVSDSETGPKTPKSPFLARISPFVFPNLTLGWVGGLKDLGKGPPLIWPMDMSYRQEFDLIITAIPSIPIHKSLWNRNLSKDEQVHTIPPVLVTGDQYHHSLISLWSFQLSELICNPSCFLFLVQPIASAAFKKWHFLQMAFMRWSSRSHKKVKGQSQGWQRTLFFALLGPFPYSEMQNLGRCVNVSLKLSVLSRL